MPLGAACHHRWHRGRRPWWLPARVCRLGEQGVNCQTVTSRALMPDARCPRRFGSPLRPKNAQALATRASLAERTASPLHLPLDHHPLDLHDGLGGVEALRAGLGAVHDGVAAIEPERVLELVEPLAGRLVAAVHDPAVCLEQDRGAEEAVAIPPIAGTAGRTAEAEDAVLQALQLVPLFRT